jgi:hypothetical protein
MDWLFGGGEGPQQGEDEGCEQPHCYENKETKKKKKEKMWCLVVMMVDGGGSEREPGWHAQIDVDVGGGTGYYSRVPSKKVQGCLIGC